MDGEVFEYQVLILGFCRGNLEMNVHFDMHRVCFSLSTMNWPWPLKCILYGFTVAASCLLYWGKRKYVTLGMRLYWKCKLFYWYTTKLHIFCHISKTTKSKNSKFQICNKKYMGYHLKTKNTLQCYLYFYLSPRRWECDDIY